uniref:Uncharacterized protein n=1 Tax=Arundo donax TaxID=35708 RepID=A0A0A8XNV0_ARUDO
MTREECKGAVPLCLFFFLLCALQKFLSCLQSICLRFLLPVIQH